MASPPPGSTPDPTTRLVGQFPAIQALRAQIRHLAAFDTVGNPHVPPLLLQGETGTGKGLVALVVHDSGPRASGPFVEVNCAAIPDTLLEAELFGYEAGAFSGAKRAKPGLFEAASGGTLFLDEIDSMPLALQGKLLTALEVKRVRRLGAVREQAVDIKLIAAAQADLGGAVQVGWFRADLYYRLAVVVLTLPPLRDRGEDILVLAQAYLHRYAAAHRVRPKRLSPGAEVWLRGHHWPGNVRELSHLIERVTLLSEEPILEAETLARLSLRLGKPPAPTGSTPATGVDQPSDEAARIRQALQDVGGNVVQAARRLGLSRSGLRYRMQLHGIAPPARGTGPSPRHAGRGTSAPDHASPPPADAPVPASGWEQKPVAVLAIDLTFPTTLGPVEPWTIASRWEEAIGEKVRGFGGVVLQRLSSLFAVAFGVPLALEQLPERAVRAALAIRQLVADASAAGAAGGPIPEVRQAVHLGTMLIETQAGALIERYQAEGDTLSLAVRLLGHVGPGELWVSAQFGRLVAGWCELQACDVPSRVGQSPLMTAYCVAGLLPRCSPRVELGARALSRFVGRTRELARLGELLAQVEQGRGQVVGIVGEPGIGKSRLIYEFTRAHQAHGWRVLDGRAVAYGKATPYLPVIDLLKTYFHIGARHDGNTIHAKVTGKLRTLEEDLGPTLPALLTLLDVPVEDPQWQALDPMQRRQRILDAVKGLLLCESHIQPVLLIVEDLQWVDNETQAVLDSFIESLPTARILLLVNYRPEYQHGWGNKTYYTQLRLDPLTPESAEELLQALLGDDASLTPLKQFLLGRTDGNPFFLEESVRTLVETQLLVGEHAYRLAKPIQSPQVPVTVQAVLAARIDRLPPEEKRLLQTAAVIGTEVSFPLLQAIVEVPEEALSRDLTRLQAAEFPYETQLFPEREYTFKHALTQEVAYGGLPRERRQALHARIVGALETLAGDRVSEEVGWLAYHAFRGEVWEKALAYCRQAGEKALARSAYREAVTTFEQALLALQHLPEDRDTLAQAIDLRLDLRHALLVLGEPERIFEYLQEAERLAQALDDQRRLGQVSAHLSSYFCLMRANHGRALEPGHRARAIAQTLGDVTLEAEANLRLGQAYYGLGQYHRALEFLRRNLGAHQQRWQHVGHSSGRLAPHLLSAFSSTWLVGCLAELGVFPESISRGEDGVRAAEAVDQPYGLIAVYFAVGVAYLNKGDLQQAISRLERALELCQVAKIPVWFPPIASYLVAAYALSGRLAEALALLGPATERATAIHAGVGVHSIWLTSLGQAYGLAGHLDDARQMARRALALAREHQERGWEAYALRLLREVAARRDPPEAVQAERYYHQALTLTTELEMRPLLAHCHLGLGTLYGQSGHLAPARAELSTVLEDYRAMEMTFWLSQAEAALVHVEGRC